LRQIGFSWIFCCCVCCKCLLLFVGWEVSICLDMVSIKTFGLENFKKMMARLSKMSQQFKKITSWLSTKSWQFKNWCLDMAYALKSRFLTLFWQFKNWRLDCPKSPDSSWNDILTGKKISTVKKNISIVNKNSRVQKIMSQLPKKFWQFKKRRLDCQKSLYKSKNDPLIVKKVSTDQLSKKTDSLKNNVSTVKKVWTAQTLTSRHGLCRKILIFDIVSVKTLDQDSSKS
jgi:hypothetical protein